MLSVFGIVVGIVLLFSSLSVLVQETKINRIEAKTKSEKVRANSKVRMNKNSSLRESFDLSKRSKPKKFRFKGSDEELQVKA